MQSISWLILAHTVSISSFCFVFVLSFLIVTVSNKKNNNFLLKKEHLSFKGHLCTYSCFPPPLSQYFTGQREEFEGTRENMLVWLTELDLQLTNVEHFSESDVHHKIQQLNVRSYRNCTCSHMETVNRAHCVRKNSPQIIFLFSFFWIKYLFLLDL